MLGNYITAQKMRITFLKKIRRDEKMKKKVVGFGSFVVDLMARAPRLPVAGETVRGTLFRQGAGGKGFIRALPPTKPAVMWP